MPSLARRLSWPLGLAREPPGARADRALPFGRSRKRPRRHALGIPPQRGLEHPVLGSRAGALEPAGLGGEARPRDDAPDQLGFTSSQPLPIAGESPEGSEHALRLSD